MPPRRRKKRKLEEKAPCHMDLSSGSGAAAAPPVYMLVGHGSVRPAYSVFKVDPYAGGGGKGKGKNAPCRALVRLKCKHSKSFVPVRSKHGAWIVGVGGSSTQSRYGAETIIFDTETHAVMTGPKPGSTKRSPVLLTVGERIYALARCPSINGRAQDPRVNFCPWFEVLDLSAESSKVVDGCLTGCEWRTLPRPHFFPWGLNPYQYIRPYLGEFTVSSYAAVGSHILVSVIGQTATYAFDTEMEQWTTVDDKNVLPFIHGAIPHGPELFLAISRATRAITAYKISVIAGSSLAIMEIPVSSDLLPGDEEVETTHNFLSLGIHRGFCSVSCQSLDKSWDPPYLRACIKVIAYGTEDFEMGGCLQVSKQWKKLYEIHDSVRELDDPCVAGVFSLV